MSKIKIVFAAMLVAMVSLAGCSADKADIVGRWMSADSSELGDQLVEVMFNDDMTGSMIVYSNNTVGGERACIADFEWSIDGYLVNISGYYADDDSRDPNSFSTQFRYTDGKLVCEGFIPAARNSVSSTKSNCILSKQ